MTPAAQLAVLAALVERIPFRPDMRTPAEVERDVWLESLAVSRAEGGWVSGRDADRAADLFYGDSS